MQGRNLISSFRDEINITVGKDQCPIHSIHSTVSPGPLPVDNNYYSSLLPIYVCVFIGNNMPPTKHYRRCDTSSHGQWPLSNTFV